MVCQCSQLQFGEVGRLASGRARRTLSCAPKIGNAWQSFKGYSVADLNGRTVFSKCQRLQMLAALQPPLLRVIFPKADREYGQRQDLEKIIRFMHKCVLSALCQSASISLAPFLAHTHRHTHAYAHTELDSAKTPMGECFWLLEMSNCFVMSNLSQWAQSAVLDAGMCVSSAQKKRNKPLKHVPLGLHFGLTPW